MRFNRINPTRLERMQRYRSTAHTHAHTRIQTHKHTNTQTHKHTNTQTHKHTNTQTHKHTNTEWWSGTKQQKHYKERRYTLPLGNGTISVRIRSWLSEARKEARPAASIAKTGVFGGRSQEKKLKRSPLFRETGFMLKRLISNFDPPTKLAALGYRMYRS